MSVLSLTMIGRLDSACGQSGTSAMPVSVGFRIGPPADIE
jgi:hypothetical protein